MLRAIALLSISILAAACGSTVAAVPTPPSADSPAPSTAPAEAAPDPTDVAGSAEPLAAPAAPASAAVRIANFAFDPETTTIAAGGTVTWTNADGDRHSIVIDGLESDRLESGATFSHAFATAGTYAYACGLHSSMTGTVVVLGSGSNPGVAAPADPAPAPTASPDDRDEDDDRDDDHSGDDGGDDDGDEDHSGHRHGGGDDGDEDHSGPGGGGSGHG